MNFVRTCVCMNNHLVVHLEFDYASVKYRSWRWLRFIGISAIQSSIIVEDQFDLLQNLRHSKVVLVKTFEKGISRMAKSAQLDQADARLLRTSMISYLVCCSRIVRDSVFPNDSEFFPLTANYLIWKEHTHIDAPNECTIFIFFRNWQRERSSLIPHLFYQLGRCFLSVYCFRRKSLVNDSLSKRILSFRWILLNRTRAKLVILTAITDD
jgi:hypothetical protein